MESDGRRTLSLKVCHCDEDQTLKRDYTRFFCAFGVAFFRKPRGEIVIAAFWRSAVFGQKAKREILHVAMCVCVCLRSSQNAEVNN